MRIFKNILLVGLLLTVSNSCKELLDDQPRSEINAENFYQSEADALAAVFACYEYLGGGSFNDNFGGLYYNYYWVIQALCSDEGQNNDAVIDKQRLSSFTFDPSNAPIFQVWRDAYRSIAACNIAIANIPNVQMDEAKRNAYVGEARFIRGLVYFELVRMFGDLPLVLETVTSVSEANSFELTPEADVYAQIIDDLTFARNNMVAAQEPVYAGRATKYSASAVLAKVYLTLGRYDESIAELQAVMESGKYSLWDDYADVFKIDNNNGKEVVFSINFSNTQLFWESGQFNVRLLPAELNASLNSFAWERPTDNLYNSFQPDDRRKDVTFITSYTKDGVTTDFLPHIQKYWDRSKEPNASSTFNDLQLYRYADILLMYAEALNEKSGPGDEAYAAVNAIRKRARYHGPSDIRNVLPDLGGLTQDALRDSILVERKREFAFEGHRWFDLVRRNKLIAEVKKAKPTANVQEYHKHFPIPQRVIDISAVPLKQNDGYSN